MKNFPAELKDICEKVKNGIRLDFNDGLKLFESPHLDAVGALASIVRWQKHKAHAYYVLNRQINYTNICVNGCLFCAFRRDNSSQPGAFLLSHDDILNRIEDKSKSGLDELHIVGGCHPELSLAYFEELLCKIKNRYPELPVKAFTPVEILHFARLEDISPRDVLQRLKKAGLQMLPGGGAEIFDADLRQRLCPHKANADQWLQISGYAHELGIKSNCTMLFAHIEDYRHRIEHLLRLREQQDKSGGFVCFIPLPFLKKNSRLELPKNRQGPADAFDLLKTIAVSRLMLDNIPHIKAYWIMLGTKLAQVALCYGADDLDGTIVEERIGHMAGARSAQAMAVDELEWMIAQSGFMPVRRNAVFELKDM